MRIRRSCFLLALVSLLSFASAAKEKSDRKNDGRVQAEESQDYFRKWLTEDVIYIITEDERAIFEALTNEAEKEQFIEQFWYRRDPDLRTPINEFKEEHYRRIAYSNERFHSGKSGWKSDRGRIYIIHGPPDEIEDYGGGGQYVRESYEGGGTHHRPPLREVAVSEDRRTRERHHPGVRGRVPHGGVPSRPQS